MTPVASAASPAASAPDRHVVVVTGASEGIGRELARQIAAGGARVLGDAASRRVGLVLAARQTARLDELAAALASPACEVLVVTTDVAERDDNRRLVDATLARFGRLDTLLLNAGRSAHANLADVPADRLDWYEALMRVNFWGPAWTAHAALPALRAARGRIVAVSSVAGLVGVPGRTAYCATKFALGGFFEALRIELIATGVSVTIAYPGVVATDIRRRGFDALGRAAGVSALDESGAMRVDDCARRILAGAAARRRDVVMTASARAGRLLKVLAPGVVDRVTLAAVDAAHRPKA